jgi:HEAT repeat protein
MTWATVVLVTAGVMLAVAVLTVFAWLLYTGYLNRAERRLAARKSLYRDLVSELAPRDRDLLDSTIHQMKTLSDLDALEAVLEEQARSSITPQAWILEVYDELGLLDKYIDRLRAARAWRDRAFAAELLGRVGSAKAVPPLLEAVQATGTEDADVREIALRALTRISDPRAAGPLAQALSDADPWLIPRLTNILVRHGEAAVDPLLTLLDQSSRPMVQAWAATALGTMGAQRAFPALLRHLANVNDEVRARCATALGELADSRALVPLLDRLLVDPAPVVRERIALGLSHFHTPDVIDRLVHALRDPESWVRMRSIEALERIGSAAEGPLVVALDDPDPEVRVRVAVALERLGVTDKVVQLIEAGETGAAASELLVRLSAGGTSELLTQLLRHRSTQVRQAVITAVTRVRRLELVAELVQTASSDDEAALRAHAFDALRALEAGEALTAAVAGLTDPDQRVRAAAVTLIGKLGGPEEIELLRSRTSDPDAAVRAAAAGGLGAMRAEAEADFLRLLGDPKPAVRLAAVAGVAAARLRSLVPTLIELLEDNDEDVRLGVAQALGELGDQAAVAPLVRAFYQAGTPQREIIIRAVSHLDLGVTPELISTLLDSPEPDSKRAGVRAIERLRYSGASEILIRLSGSPDPGLRALALEALGRSGRTVPPETLTQVVARALNDQHEAVRAQAADLVARFGLRHEAPAIVSLLRNDSSSEVRERAALATGLMQLPGGEDALLDIVRRKGSPSVRAAAALALAFFDGGSLVTRVTDMADGTAVRDQLRIRLAHDPCYRLLGRKISRNRALELRALAAAQPHQAQHTLAEGMQRTLDPAERVKLINGLRALEGEQSLAALHRVLREDPSPEVRAAALEAMGLSLDTDELLATGTRALADPSIQVRRTAMGLFARITPERRFPRLLHTLRAEDDPSLLAAAAELGEQDFFVLRDVVTSLPLDAARAALVVEIASFIHHPDLPSLLAPFGRSGWPEVREAVAELWRRRPEAVEGSALEGLIVDPAVRVRLAAAGATASARRYDLLRRMSQDPVANVRRQVAVALGRAAPVLPPGLAVLDRLGSDPEMPVRAAAYAARLAQGAPVPLPPGLAPSVVAEAVRDTLDLAMLRATARTTPSEDSRLAAGLALALLQDEVAREIARTDPIPAIRHRVGGALELAMTNGGGEQ